MMDVRPFLDKSRQVDYMTDFRLRMNASRFNVT